MLKLVSFVLLAILCVSCFNINCEVIGESRRSKECNIVVEGTPNSERWFAIKGVNPNTKEKSSYKDMETWYVYFFKNIEVGDTVVKKKGELKFYIHKKDTTLVYPYTCDGKVYE